MVVDKKPMRAADIVGSNEAIASTPKAGWANRRQAMKQSSRLSTQTTIEAAKAARQALTSNIVVKSTATLPTGSQDFRQMRAADSPVNRLAGLSREREAEAEYSQLRVE